MAGALRYFHSDVLAMFHNQSEKYSIKTDEFEGKVRIRDGYCDERVNVYLNVSFGFRAARGGEWAVAAYAPDLAKASPGEERKWTGFEIDNEQGFVLAYDRVGMHFQAQPVPDWKLGSSGWPNRKTGSGD